MAQEHDDQVDAAPPNVVRFVMAAEAVEGTPEPLEPEPFLAPEVAEAYTQRWRTRNEVMEALRIPGEGFRQGWTFERTEGWHIDDETAEVIRRGGWREERPRWRNAVQECLQLPLTPEDAAELANALSVALDLDLTVQRATAERLGEFLLRLLNPETI